jgi:hypothetical protein
MQPSPGLASHFELHIRSLVFQMPTGSYAQARIGPKAAYDAFERTNDSVGYEWDGWIDRRHLYVGSDPGR